MDDEDSLIPRAFDVQGELGPEAGPPTNGFDYLRRVRSVKFTLCPFSFRVLTSGGADPIVEWQMGGQKSSHSCEV